MSDNETSGACIGTFDRRVSFDVTSQRHGNHSFCIDLDDLSAAKFEDDPMTIIVKHRGTTEKTNILFEDKAQYESAKALLTGK
jgi:hypothetical protein